MSILSFFISDAVAATAGAGHAAPSTSESIMSMMPMFAIIILFMYFMVIRPQQKRAKEHRTLMGGLKKGDEVATNGGVLGRIVKVTDDFIVLDIAESTEITVQKPAISTVLPKGTLKSI